MISMLSNTGRDKDTVEDEDSLDDVDEASLEKLDEAIVAAEEKEVSHFYVCPSCGSRDIGIIRSNIDATAVVFPPWQFSFHCRSCGYEGVPLLFDDDEAYQMFLKSRSN